VLDRDNARQTERRSKTHSDSQHVPLYYIILYLKVRTNNWQSDRGIYILLKVKQSNNKIIKMEDIIPKTVQRFHIPPETLSKNNQSSILPIVNRSNEAKQKNVKLHNVSPVCVIVVGMAGSGKTTLTAALQRSLMPPSSSSSEEEEQEGGGGGGEEEETTEGQEKDGKTATATEQEQEESDTTKTPVGYCLNLDPATKLVPFAASIDIRDTVNYKEVMKQHKLGPNGAIMTSLNLFSTKFDQVLSILEKRSFTTKTTTPIETTAATAKAATAKAATATTTTTTTTNQQKETTIIEKNLDYILVDTPGQIEVFTWSASGSIITSALSTSFPTVLAYVIDTPRCISSLNTFISNMLYACSMHYKTHLPIVIVFSKVDVMSSNVCMEWMENYESFQLALDNFMDNGNSSYYTSLTRSLSLVLDEFYSTTIAQHKVGISSITGEGINDFWTIVQQASNDFDLEYVNDLKCRLQEQQVWKQAVARDSLGRLKEDIEKDE